MKESRFDNPDTPADVRLRELLDADDLPGFTMIAGAGSGKTTSLVKALAHVTSTRGGALRKRTQQVACITYTEVASEEIFVDAGSNPLTHVSTVHSFLWSVISPFQRDIWLWVRSELEAKEAKLRSEQAEFGSRVQQKRRDKVAGDILKTCDQLSGLSQIKKFRYGVGPDLGNGVLGHEHVIKMATQFIQTRPLLVEILGKKYPIVFVDESQDTFPEVVDSLKHVKAKLGSKFCVGFFGDPMQKVYPRGIGEIDLEPGWVSIKKPENFRSPRRVLEVMNHIRADGDGLTQVSGRKKIDLKDGVVEYFVLPADERRSENLRLVRMWLDDQTEKGAWTTDDHYRGAKILVIAHRMAARRLGFENLYSAFHDCGSPSLSQAFDEGTAWPLRFLLESVLPLAEGDTSAQIASLRRNSPKFDYLRQPGADVGGTLGQLRLALSKMREYYQRGGVGSVGDILRTIAEGDILSFDPRFGSYLGLSSASSVVVSSSTENALNKLMECDIREVLGYRTYLSKESPFSTHQGVKGAEFKRVLVVLDDEEGRHGQFSYEKLFGLKPPSDTDHKNISEGRDSVFARTRRLLYVCLSRSTSALAVVFYCQDVDRAAAVMRQSGLPDVDQLMVLGSSGELRKG